jgi:hypothetical protein
MTENNDRTKRSEYHWIRRGTIHTTKTYMRYSLRWNREFQLRLNGARNSLPVSKPPIRFFDSVEGVELLRSNLPPTVTISDVERNRLSRQIRLFHDLRFWLFEINPRLIIRKIWGVGFQDYDIDSWGDDYMHVVVLKITYRFEMEERDVREFLRKHKSLRDYSRNFDFRFNTF